MPTFILLLFMGHNQKKKLVLRSSFAEMERLETFMEELQDWASFDDEHYNRIMLPLSEAVNNAILHGNKQDPAKEVIVVARIRNQTLAISVKDEGKGFDPDHLPDPLKEENLMNEGGRGVYLIRQFADEVEYSENGTKITFKITLGGQKLGEI